MTKKRFKKLVMSARYGRNYTNNLVETLKEIHPAMSYFELWYQIVAGNISIPGITRYKTETLCNGGKVTYFYDPINIEVRNCDGQ